MAWLHTWAGLLPGWLLFVIFLFGTTAFFQQEISGWMRPELKGGPVTQEALQAVFKRLSTVAPDAEEWAVSMPSARSGDPFYVSWEPRKGAGGESGSLVLSPTTGDEIAPRDTKGGWFLYLFHFELHYMPVRLAEVIVSVAALAMLVTILSGIVTHKKIFADFFMLRFGRGQRSWLDAHNLTGVLALPFHLMITYTGLAALLFTLMPWAISASFPSEDAFREAAHSDHPEVARSGTVAPMLTLTALMNRVGANDLIRGGAYFSIHHPGDAASIITINPEPMSIGADRRRIHLSGVTGEPIWIEPSARAATVTHNAMVDLHAGLFAGPVLRWLYFLSGVGGTVMVASGLILWTVKRRAKLPDPARPHFGFRLVERLNIGVIAGVPAGIAIYFLANRLLPLDVAHRAEWEINSLFIAWGGLFVWTLARPAKRAWVEALVACAALYALVPVVNALTTTRGLIPSLIARDWVFAGFDLVMLAMAAACAFTAWKVATDRLKAAPRRKARELVEASA